jgi:hypothetical protein
VSGSGWTSTSTETRVAQTELTLVSGGKAASHHRNLIQLNVVEGGGFMTQMLEGGYRGVHPWQQEPATRAVPPKRVILGELGAVGSDGRLWKALPDNQQYSITPKVSPALHPDHYRFNVKPTKHKLFIEANGIQLDPDRVVTNAEFCVGQKIVLRPKLVPDVSGNLIDETNGYWWLPPKYVIWVCT